MKTNSRRRVLISSVAMLLVALVALGTATFAWFTQSTAATADEITVRTAKSSSLEISGATKDWGTTVKYGFNKLLIPASAASSEAWFTADAADEDSFESAVGAVQAVELDSTALTNTTYFFRDQLNIRNAGSAAVNNVQIKFSIGNASAYDYLRIAVVPTNNRGVGIKDTGTFAECVYANTSTNAINDQNAEVVPYGAIKSVTGTDKDQTFATTTITPITNANGTFTIDVADTMAAAVKDDSGNVTYNNTKYYNIYVWFEGQDIDCFNGNAGVEIPNISFEVTGQTAAESNG